MMTRAERRPMLPPPPGPTGLPILGSAFELWRNPVAFFSDVAREYGGLARVRFGPHAVFVVTNAPDAQHVLQKNNKSYIKGRNYDGLRLALGNGLLTSEGSHWLRQRRLAQPAFHAERLRGFSDTMTACTEHMLADWTQRKSSQLDVHREMMDLTLGIVGRTLFGSDIDAEVETIRSAVPVLLAHTAQYTRSVLRIPPWVPTPSNRRFARALDGVNGSIQRIIAARRHGGKRATGPGDMLDMFIEATDDQDAGRMNDQQLRDEMMTMIGAGHETTANALTWTFLELSRHPDIERKLHDEVDTVLARRRPTLADLPQLVYTEQVLNEALRLHPPAWTWDREAIAEDELSGYPVAAGSLVLIVAYALHRNPEYWTSPEQFDPDRFSAARSAGRPSHAFIPFSTGARMCIGKSFAMMEAKLILAMVAQQYSLRIPRNHRVRVSADVTLRPIGGLPATLAKRT